MKSWAQKVLYLAVILLLLIVSSGCIFTPNSLPEAAPPEAVPTETTGNKIFLPMVLNVPAPATVLRAFPGAEGFGRDSVGGRGGRVVEVTNLNNDGLGSFRAAVEATGPRVVIFRVSGTIELRTAVKIRNPYITIAGQTAPGGGITLKNNPSNTDSTLIVITHDVVIRYIRIRSGPPNVTSSDGDALEILSGAYNLIVDHCSFSWGLDETVSTWYDAHDITIQWSIIAEGLDCSMHVKGCHSMGLLLGSDGSGNISVHHNLFAHNGQRNPVIQPSGGVDIVNNVIFDAVYTPMEINDGYGAVSANIVGNFYKRTLDNAEYLVSPSSETGLGMKIYLLGNITPTRPNDSLAEELVVKPRGRQWVVTTRTEAPPITTTTAFDAYDQVLAEAGATIGLDSLGSQFTRRDSVDERILNDVINNIARKVNDPSEVGGWPILATGEPPEDTDKDGMPNEWEELFGFNPSNPADGATDADGDGYTNLEEYLNGTYPNP